MECDSHDLQPVKKGIRMINYLVTHKKTKKTLLFTYDLNGFLIAFKCNFKMNKAINEYLKQTFPLDTYGMVKYTDEGSFRVDELKQDLTFKAFWNAFANKVGNKKKAEELWDALTEVEKAKALNYIPKYNDFLIQNQGIQRLFPTTYLNQKRFDNE